MKAIDTFCCYCRIACALRADTKKNCVLLWLYLYRSVNGLLSFQSETPSKMAVLEAEAVRRGDSSLLRLLQHLLAKSQPQYSHCGHDRDKERLITRWKFHSSKFRKEIKHNSKFRVSCLLTSLNIYNLKMYISRGIYSPCSFRDRVIAETLFLFKSFQCLKSKKKLKVALQILY